MKVSSPFFVWLDNLDVQFPWVLMIFLKIGMAAHKYPPKLSHGGSGCKIQYEIYDFRATSLDEMITGAKTLIFSQELDCFRTQALGAPWVYAKPRPPSLVACSVFVDDEYWSSGFSSASHGTRNL